MLTKEDEPLQNGYYWIRTAQHEIFMLQRETAGLWLRLDRAWMVQHPFAWWCGKLSIVAIERVKPASWLKEWDAQ